MSRALCHQIRGKVSFTAALQLASFIEFLTFELCFGANVEGLQNPCIDGRDDVHGTVEIGFVNARFPCVRKASLHSRLAIAHHGNGEAHQHLFALGEVVDGVCIAIELAKISPIAHVLSLLRQVSQGGNGCLAPRSFASRPGETRFHDGFGSWPIEFTPSYLIRLIGKGRFEVVVAKCLPRFGCNYGLHSNPVWAHLTRPPAAR